MSLSRRQKFSFVICVLLCCVVMLYLLVVLLVTRGDTHTIRFTLQLSTKYFKNFFTSAVFLYFARHGERIFLVSCTPGKRFFGEQSKALNHARESGKGIMPCNLFPLSKKSPQQSPIFRWSLRLSLDRSRCCLFNRNHRVYKRQEKNATYTNFFHLAQIAAISNNRLKHVSDSRRCVHANNVHSTMSNDRFNQTFVSCNAGYVHMRAVHLFAVHACAVHLIIPNGRLRCLFE